MVLNPVRRPDKEARAMARALLHGARHAALAVQDPEDGMPSVSRIALAPHGVWRALSVISDLAVHAAALKACPDCALLVGEPGAKGDPLTHPRLSLKSRARFVRHGDAAHARLARAYLAQRPKAKLYIGFGDFSIVVFEPVSALLNGGFGKAYAFAAADLAEA